MRSLIAIWLCCNAFSFESNSDFFFHFRQSLADKVPAIVFIQSDLSEMSSAIPNCSPADLMWHWYREDRPTSPIEFLWGKQKRERGVRQTGSGFFISSDGFILTSYLTIKDAKKIKVVISEEMQTDQVIVVGCHPKSNLALLKIEGTNFPYLSLDDRPIRHGEWVAGIAKNSAGYADPRFGIVVFSPRLDSKNISYETLIQSDLIKTERGGDPLFGLDGKLIGVNIISDLIQLSVPSSIVKEIVEELKSY